jgi:hypothetical protein
MVFRVVDERRKISAVGIPRHGIGDRPTGEGSGRLLDVVLAIIQLAVLADAHREQFQQFPTPVFVDGAVMAHAVVQVEHHGRIIGKAHQQAFVPAHAVAAEHIDFEALLAGMLAFGVSGAENAMPEQGHLLLEWLLAVDHTEDPLFLLALEAIFVHPLGLVPHHDIVVELWLRLGMQ